VLAKAAYKLKSFEILTALSTVVGFLSSIRKLKMKKKSERSEEASQTDIIVETEPARLQWDSFWEYFLSIIGFVIDLGKCIFVFILRV
jgi:hypothetical protein